MTLADRIQRLRKQKGLSQEQLADQIGVSRQAISKWESEQSSPDLEKIILLSEFFEVTTDFILKGDEVPSSSDMPIGTTISKSESTNQEQEMRSKECIEETSERGIDSRVVALIATAINFIGLVVACGIWMEKRTTIAVVIGLAIMSIGCVLFLIGRYIGFNVPRATYLFCIINTWILSLIPMSCCFNFLQGHFGGYWWTFTPFPQLGNSRILFYAFWMCYIAMCCIVDIILMEKQRKKRIHNDK